LNISVLKIEYSMAGIDSWVPAKFPTKPLSSSKNKRNGQ
jgi:hypothetical protein